MWGNIHIVGVLAALTGAMSIGSWGGTLMEDLLETQIDLRRPASFPYWDNLVVRQQNFDTLFYNDSDSGEHKSMHIGNWETYTLRYWYEYRIRHAACPQKPIGIAAATDLSLLCTCLFGQVNVCAFDSAVSFYVKERGAFEIDHGYAQFASSFDFFDVVFA